MGCMGEQCKQPIFGQGAIECLFDLGHVQIVDQRCGFGLQRTALHGCEDGLHGLQGRVHMAVAKLRIGPQGRPHDLVTLQGGKKSVTDVDG